MTCHKPFNLFERLRHLVPTLALALLVMRLGPGLASTVTVVTSKAGGSYDEVTAALRQELVKTGVRLQTMVAATNANAALPKLPADTVLVITIGVQAAQQVQVGPEQTLPLLNIFLPRAAFDNITGGKKFSRRPSAIFIDQPYSRQLNLLQTVLPAARNLGLIASPANDKEVDIYRGLARARGMSVVAEQASREAELYPALQSVLRSSDVLLAMPDAYVVNASTAQNLLLTSFRFRVPVIGYSAAYVKAGALAGVYSTPHQIGQEAGQIARQFIRTNSLPAPKHPLYFTVSINYQVAKSLGYSVADEVAITRRLQQMESAE